MARVMEDHVKYEEKYILNSRGMRLFTCKWFRMDREPRALVFLCHGYALDCSTTMEGAATRLAREGFAVHGIDCEGHGKSDGLMAHIQNFDALVRDCFDHFSSIIEMRENSRKMRFLMGFSMGGAVALLLHRLKPHYWDGAILIAPMCRIAGDVKPPRLVVSVMKKLAKFRPTWKNIIANDIISVAYKMPQTRRAVRENPYCYKGRLRLQTGCELLRVSEELEHGLHEVSLPFIVLHGEEDKVTDKAASKKLYHAASSSDKTLKLYPGMWHSLVYGEPPENVEIVLADVIQWIEQRLTPPDDLGSRL